MQKIVIEQFMKTFKELLELIKQNNEKIESLEQTIYELKKEIEFKL